MLLPAFSLWASGAKRLAAVACYGGVGFSKLSFANFAATADRGHAMGPEQDLGMGGKAPSWLWVSQDCLHTSKEAHMEPPYA